MGKSIVNPYRNECWNRDTYFYGIMPLAIELGEAYYGYLREPYCIKGI